MKLQFPAMSCKFKTDPKYIVVRSPAVLMYSDEHAGLQYNNWLHLYMTEHLNVSISKVTLIIICKAKNIQSKSMIKVNYLP